MTRQEILAADSNFLRDVYRRLMLACDDIRNEHNTDWNKLSETLSRRVMMDTMMCYIAVYDTFEAESLEELSLKLAIRGY